VECIGVISLREEEQAHVDNAPLPANVLRVTAGKDVAEGALDHPHRADLVEETSAESAESFGMTLRGIALSSGKPCLDVAVTSKVHVALSCQVQNIVHRIIKCLVKRASQVGVPLITRKLEHATVPGRPRFASEITTR